MEPFHWKDKTIEFGIHSGKMSGARKWSETRVGSYGGGGYISKDRGGYISSPSVYSTVTTKLDFFLIKQNGEEIPVQLSNVNIPIRDGQNTSMIYGALKGNQNLWNWLILINHNAQRYWQILSGKQIIRYFKLERGVPCSWLFATITGFTSFTLLCIFINDITERKLSLVYPIPILITGIITFFLIFDQVKVTRARKKLLILLSEHLTKIANHGFVQSE